MTARLLLLILTSVLCSSIAQILLRTGMSQPVVSHTVGDHQLLQTVLRIALNPWVLGGLGLYFGGALVWLSVLARAQASFAYPFVGLGFVLTLIFGVALLNESLTALKVGGTLLISLGAVLIAVS